MLNGSEVKTWFKASLTQFKGEVGEAGWGGVWVGAASDERGLGEGGGRCVGGIEKIWWMGVEMLV